MKKILSILVGIIAILNGLYFTVGKDTEIVENIKTKVVDITYDVKTEKIPLIRKNKKEVKIASFNALHLGWKGKDYITTAKVLKDFDLIGVIEVMDEEGLLILRNQLNKETKKQWRFYISDNKVGSKRYKEYYGYLWREDIFEFQEDLGFYKEEQHYDFIREPFAANFKSGEFDFTFILSHIKYGERARDREKEISKLNKVYNYFQTRNADENDVILAGDFNMPADSLSYSRLLKNKEKIKYIITPEMKTTIGKKKLASSYDNMFFSSIHTGEYTGSGGVHNYLEDLKITDLLTARKTVSDHLPIFGVFNTEVDDD